MEQQTGMVSAPGGGPHGGPVLIALARRKQADLAFPASNAPEPLKEKPDLLSRLPAEMLDFIFREAWTDGRPSGPINRALLPWTDRSHWHTIILKSVDSCERYREICERRPHLPYACDTLRVELDVHKEEIGRAWLEQLLPGIINLHHLSLSDLTGPRMPAWRSAWRRRRTTDCAASAAALHALPHLEGIRLNLRSSNAPAAKLEASEGYSFSQVRRLTVTLPRKGSSSVHLLIASCLNLHGLGLSSAGPAPGFAGVLASLTNPSMLNSLELHGYPQRAHDRPILPLEVRSFVSLHDLKLTGNWEGLSGEDDERLCALPLRHFSLGPKSEFRPDPFLAHLQGGGLPHLKTLRFDNVTATRGWVVGDNIHPEAFLWRDRIEQIRCAMKSWKPARWTPVFVRSNAYALREVCRARKIRLEGSIIEALQVADALAGMKDEIKQLRRLISRSGDGPSAASP
ncbi:hypothetical protein JCM8202_004918 [Rhodotorula sphaerocarpa]